MYYIYMSYIYIYMCYLLYIYMSTYYVFNCLRRVPPATMERAFLQAANSPCISPARTWLVFKTWFLRRTRKKGLCGKDSFQAKIEVLFRPRPKSEPKHICKVGFLEEAILRKVLGKAALTKVMRVRVCSEKNH